MAESPNPVVADRLRAALDRAGYGEAAVGHLLGLHEIPTERRLRQAVPLHLWRTRDGSALATLVRLFLLGQPVPAAAAEAALATQSVDDAFAAGLLTGDTTAPRAAVQIAPVDRHYVAADWTAGANSEPVMGVAASTRALAQMMIPGAAERALDLGSGSGVLALLAARHANHVIAADLNPRAGAMTAFNAALNGVTNVESRTGDLFEPVRDETFDRIVCNPPFVIAPAAGPLHSQAGKPADDLLRVIVQAAPRHLQPAGFCQVVGNWVHPAGGDWRARLAGWVDGLGCDAWALQARTEDAATYAHQRIAEATDDPGYPRSGSPAARMFDEWMADYERQGIEAVGYGVITLRRSTRGTSWFRCDPLPDVEGPCGPAIAQGFALRDFLEANRSDDALLAARVRRADDLVWERHSDLAAGGWSAGGGLLRHTTGLRFGGAADQGVAGFVAACDGRRPLGEELAKLAGEMGQDRRRFAPAFLKVVRRLIEVGVLVPVDAACGLAVATQR
jgi:SAM-dependent methyltransferase